MPIIQHYFCRRLCFFFVAEQPHMGGWLGCAVREPTTEDVVLPADTDNNKTQRTNSNVAQCSYAPKYVCTYLSPHFDTPNKNTLAWQRCCPLSPTQHLSAGHLACSRAAPATLSGRF